MPYVAPVETLTIDKLPRMLDDFTLRELRAMRKSLNVLFGETA